MVTVKILVRSYADSSELYTQTGNCFRLCWIYLSVANWESWFVWTDVHSESKLWLHAEAKHRTSFSSFLDISSKVSRTSCWLRFRSRTILPALLRLQRHTMCFSFPSVFASILFSMWALCNRTRRACVPHCQNVRATGSVSTPAAFRENNLNVCHFTLCARAGLYGRLTPLVLVLGVDLDDLPPNTVVCAGSVASC